MIFIRGNIWILEDNIDTDVILPGPYIPITDPIMLAAHALEGLDINFSQRVKPGDIIVAGRNFGCGSSREQAPVALKHAGVAAIVAESFARIFYRNAMSIGLPVFTCPGIALLANEQEEIEIALDTGEIRRISTGQCLQAERLPNFLLEIIHAGGLVPHLKQKFSGGGI